MTAQSIITVEVRRGERIRDLWMRLEADGASTVAQLQDVAARATYPALPWVPPPRSDPARFEGLFAPGEYTMPVNQPETSEATRAIVDTLLAAAAPRFTDVTPPAGLTLYQCITLASIVEKEAVARKDYDRVAAVFLNRLRFGMTLSSCPSVEYALGYHRPYLNRADISMDAPTNTYLHKGVPPTPIAFFTDKALAGVLKPAATRDEFFTFDWATGELYFAVDYAHHQINVETARKDFVRAFGQDAMYQKNPDKYYDY